jgi:ubiquinone/menaquinone biosynthesis C-methylase UbiE
MRVPYLAGRGHAVVGVDYSEDMLAVARARLPHGDFRAGSLDHLPVPDSSADLIVCALALAHMPELGVVIANSRVCSAPAGTWSSPTPTMNSSSEDRS